MLCQFYKKRRVSTAVMAVFRHFAEAYGRRERSFPSTLFVCATIAKPAECTHAKGKKNPQPERKARKQKPVDACGYLDHSKKNIFAPRRQKPEMADAGGDNGKHQDVAAQLCHGFKTVHDHGIEDASLCGCPVFCRFQVCKNRRAFFFERRRSGKSTCRSYLKETEFPPEIPPELFPPDRSGPHM